jgi:transcriptional regulator with XRE-family HTH domain
MARAALGWRAADLAEAAGVHRVTVARYESGEAIDAQSLSAMQTAFADRGVLFSRRSGRVGVTAAETAAEQASSRRQVQEAGGAIGKAKPEKPK